MIDLFIDRILNQQLTKHSSCEECRVKCKFNKHLRDVLFKVDEEKERAQYFKG